MFRALSGVLLLTLAPQVYSAADPWTLNLHLENDLFANTDLNYTNGVRASWVSPDVNDFLETKQETYLWIANLNRLLAPLHPDISSQQPVHRNIVISIGQLMFTPEDKQKTTLDKTDRPYAGWLYAGMGYQARTANKLHSFELNVGLVGPAALAQESQDLIHSIRGIDKFNGWDNQLHNELGIQLVFERKRRFKPFKHKIASNFDTDFITHWGGSLGNVATYVNAGAEWRLGWNLPNDFGTSSLRPGGDSNNPGLGDPSKRKLEIQTFIATDMRWVGRNIFLDGNTFRNSHSVDKKRIVTDLTIGVSTSYQRWNLSYSHVYRTKEFKGQQKDQKYGSLSISYSY